jgi:hypothetical protein
MTSSRALTESMLVVLFVVAPAADAQGLGGSSTEASLGAIGLRIDRSALRSTSAPDVPVPERPVTPAAPTEISLVGSSVTVEVGRITPDGRFIRPRLLIGLQSDLLKRRMTEMGIPAERCMLPMVRGRLKRNADNGDVGASFMVSARCTFY